jgi:hypothetical protein
MLRVKGFADRVGVDEPGLTSPRFQEVKVKPAAGVAVNVIGTPSRMVTY